MSGLAIGDIVVAGGRKETPFAQACTVSTWRLPSSNCRWGLATAVTMAHIGRTCDCASDPVRAAQGRPKKNRDLSGITLILGGHCGHAAPSGWGSVVPSQQKLPSCPSRCCDRCNSHDTATLDTTGCAEVHSLSQYPLYADAVNDAASASAQ